jgi:hypothetical protein
MILISPEEYHTKTGGSAMPLADPSYTYKHIDVPAVIDHTPITVEFTATDDHFVGRRGELA